MLVVAGSEVDVAAGSECDRSITVELDLVLPARTLGQPIRSEQKHRLDEMRFGLRISHGFADPHGRLLQCPGGPRNAPSVLEEPARDRRLRMLPTPARLL